MTQRRYEKGARASLTPRHDIPERMYQEWNDGNIDAVKQHFDNPIQAEKRCDRFNRGGGIGCFGSDQEAYFKMWERISGRLMDKEGYLTLDGVDYARLDAMLRGRACKSMPSPNVMMHNMEAAMEYCYDDDDMFLEIYTPLIYFTTEPKQAFRIWLENHDVDIIDSHNLCATYDYVGNRAYIETIFIRTDYLRRFVSIGTIQQMHEGYKNFIYYKNL